MDDGVKSVYHTDAVALDFLRSKITDPAITHAFDVGAQEGFVHAQERYPTARILVRLDEPEREFLLDQLSTLVCEIGLRPDSEPNAIGRYIEELIDSFIGG